MKGNSILSELIQNEELPMCAEIINVILFSNNDSLNEPFELYSDYLYKAKLFFKSKYKSNPMIYMKYKKIVSKISKFLNIIVEKDDYISKYCILLDLINHGYLSGKHLTRDNKKYIDGYDYYGLDAILGNCCCRHQASLIQDVLKKDINSVRLGVGKYRFGTANHCVLAVYDSELEKYVLLEPTANVIYNPNVNLKIEELNNKIRYIKANYSVTYFSDFDNVNNFLNFFNSLYESRLTKEEIEYILYRLELNKITNLKIYKSDFNELYNYIKSDREDIVKTLKR